jgi:predicted Rossmann fold nucleotide-binding protein DprA/Smf involved in DNA uptake
MKKHLSAIVTAIIITSVIGLGIFVIGVSALTNTNTVPLQNSPNTSLSGTSNNTAVSSVSSTDQVQQLQQEVSTLQSQLNQAGQIIQQYQSLLVVLQQRGIISIDRNGNVYLPQGSSGTFH